MAKQETSKRVCYGNAICLSVGNLVAQELAEKILFAERSIRINCNNKNYVLFTISATRFA